MAAAQRLGAGLCPSGFRVSVGRQFSFGFGREIVCAGGAVSGFLLCRPAWAPGAGDSRFWRSARISAGGGASGAALASVVLSGDCRLTFLLLRGRRAGRHRQAFRGPAGAAASALVLRRLRLGRRLLDDHLDQGFPARRSGILVRPQPIVEEERQRNQGDGTGPPPR